MKNPTIISEQDIIKTYNERQQEQSRLYLEYKRIKKENPEFGYKRISKILEQPEHKTRWWNSKKHLPVPIQTVNWLKEKVLIPLTIENPKIHLISRVLGTTFGDGGIFDNLNGIFLSSSEIGSVKEFGEDLKTIFGEEVEKNSRIIEGGVYGHSWCYQNTNRNIIRFFQSLGSPIGRKSNIELIVPNWIFLNEKVMDNFLGSIIGGEGSIPKYRNRTPNPITIGITGREHLKENRIKFLEQLRKYFIIKGIETNKLYIYKWKDTNIFRLPLRSTFSNIVNFYDNVPIHYSDYKKQKLEKAIEDWKRIMETNKNLTFIRL